MDEIEPNSTKMYSTPGSRPDPDPTLRTMQLVEKAMSQLESKLEVRIGGIEKAITVQHEDMVRVPTEVQKAVTSLRELLESKQEIPNERLMKLTEVSEERFKSIQTQFTLLKQATEQLDNANKTAIAAALQAQKESAGETQKTSQAAIAKSEASTSEAIRALTSSFSAAITSATDRINDLKGRLDRGEGKTSVTDPAVGAALAELSAGIRNNGKPSDVSSHIVYVLGGLLIGALVVLGAVVLSNKAAIEQIRPAKITSAVVKESV
jgi:chromosome segregation ATPase